MHSGQNCPTKLLALKQQTILWYAMANSLSVPLRPYNSHALPHAVHHTTQYCDNQSFSSSFANNILQNRLTALLTKSLILNTYTNNAIRTSSKTASKRATANPVTGARNTTIATSMNMKASNRSMNSTNPHATSPYSNERLSTSCSL